MLSVLLCLGVAPSHSSNLNHLSNLPNLGSCNNFFKCFLIIIIIFFRKQAVKTKKSLQEA